MIIESNKNPLVKQVKKLKEKKYREKEQCFIVEGVAILKDLPDTIKVRFFVVQDDKFDKYCDIIKQENYYLVTNKIMKELSDTMTPCGLIAIIDYLPLELKNPTGFSLIIDGVSDPGNMGTLIRTAVAMGVSDIYMANTCDIFSSKVIRSTMGGIFRANLHKGSIAEILDCCSQTQILALDMGGEDLYEFVPQNKLISVVVGNEAHGITDMTMQKANNIISLPQENNMESLNASVAGGIAMYILSRKINK